MTLQRSHLLLLAAGGSAALLLGALAFQHIGGLAPCPMCIWQRWPHAIAIALGLAALALPGRALPTLGAMAALTTSAIGVFHTGVERAWWEGPSSCTSGSIENLSADELFEQIMTAPLVRCDEIAWQMWGLSMPSWNAILSVLLTGLWLMALRRS